MVAKVPAGFVAALDGFEVVATASTGAQALEEVGRLQPHLVLLDVYLPDMTGLEVLRRLRADGSSVDVIVISAARDVDSIRSALHGGVLNYLVKPFDRATFEARLRDYAALHTELTEAEEVGQGDVDRVFGRSLGAPAPDRTPKGITPETLELVRRALAPAGGGGAAAAPRSGGAGAGRGGARPHPAAPGSPPEAAGRPRRGGAA